MYTFLVNASRVDGFELWNLNLSYFIFAYDNKCGVLWAKTDWTGVKLSHTWVHLYIYLRNERCYGELFVPHQNIIEKLLSIQVHQSWLDIRDLVFLTGMGSLETINFALCLPCLVYGQIIVRLASNFDLEGKIAAKVRNVADLRVNRVLNAT